MIQDSVEQTLLTFQSYWSERFAGYRWYRLDGSWPSVGIIDLITTPLRNKQDYKESELAQLQGCACYLGAIAHDCWALAAPGADIELAIDPNEKFEVTLSAIASDTQTVLQQVKITSAIVSLLQNATGTLAFFEGANIAVDERSDLISKFAIGLFSGLTPWGTGKWSQLTWSEEKESIKLIEQFLADSCLFYFSSIRNQEAISNPILELADLFLSKLILPPSGVREKVYGGLALQGLRKKLLELSSNKETIRNALQILSRTADSQIRLAASALILGDPSIGINLSLLSANAESKTELEKLLELSVFARKLNSATFSPDGNSANSLTYEDLGREYKAGLLDQLIIPIEAVNESRFIDLLTAVRSRQLGKAQDQISNLLQNLDDPWFVWLMLQKAEIEMELGNIESFDATLAFLSPIYASLDKYQQFELMYLTALKKKIDGNLVGAQEIFLFLLKSGRKERTSVLLNELGEIYIRLGQTEKLIELSQTYSESDYRFKCMLIDALKANNNMQEARTLMKKLHLEFPYSRRAFLSFLCLED